MVERIVIGLGPGRCGTTSLAKLLGMQADTVSTHECMLLPWKYNQNKLQGYVRKLLARDSLVASDASLWVLRYVPQIIKMVPASRFICLKRDNEEVYESFLNKVANRNHWTDPKSEHWDDKYKYDKTYAPCYPKYNLVKEEALVQYIVDYYGISYLYQHKFPSHFRVFDMAKLNDFEGVSEMLRFAGYQRKVCKVGIKANSEQSTQKD
jgi:hypothetical protein